MKKLRLILFILLAISNFLVFSQAPEKFNYQAVIRNDAGELINNQNVSVRISIIDNTVDGDLLYSETHSETTNTYGLVNLKVGEGTVESGNFTTIDWGVNIKFINIEVDAGSGFKDLGTIQLVSVPYALYSNLTDYANTAGTAYSADITDFADSARVAGLAHTADISNFADSARVAGLAHTANTSNIANFADSARIAGMAYTAGVADALGSEIVYSTSTDTLF
ncbi:MAG: hypothetical protein KAQ75_06280, partial [Bacteroidales bacterium]|nr:hypothetical protein [Bacteroidales bacterium]